MPPPGIKFTGLWNDLQNSRYGLYYAGTEIARYTASAITQLKAITASLGITVTAGGITITAGGLTVTAGGVVVTAGNLAVRGTTNGTILTKMGTTTDSTVGALTITAAMILSGVLYRDPNGAGRTDVLDTGTNLETALNAAGVAVATGDSFVFYIVNTADAAEAITLQGATGTTLKNAGQTIAQNESAALLFVRTGANAYDVSIIGA